MSLEEYRAYQRALADHPHTRRAIRTLVLHDPDGAPLSHLRLHAVRGLAGSEEIVLGGMAMVITPEPIRGRGYAGLLVEATIDLLRREEVDGAYLFSDIDPSFYERFGFRTAAATEVEEAVEVLPERGPEGVTVRAAVPEDLPAMRGIHERAGEGEAFWLLREPDRWEFLLARPQLRARHTLGSDQHRIHRIAERNGGVAAYALGAVEGGRLWIDEIGMDRPDQELADALLASFRSAGEAMSAERWSAPWPPGRFESIFASRFASVPRQEGILMVAALSSRLDLDAVVADARGFWETDHI